MRHQLLGQLQAVFLQCYLEVGRRFPGQNVGIDDGEALEKLKMIYGYRMDSRGTFLVLLHV